jgi:hypothetical protein
MTGAQGRADRPAPIRRCSHLTAAMRQSDQVESQLADFLEAAPSSSAGWRSGRQRPNQPPTAQLAPVSVPGAFYLQPAALTDDSVRKGTNVA